MIARAGAIIGPALAGVSVAGGTAALVWRVAKTGVALGEAGATNVLVAVGFAVAGAALTGRVARNAVGWILLLAGVTQALSVVLGVVEATGSGAAAATATWVLAWIWAPGVYGAVVLLPLLFPDGRPAGRRWRRVVRIAVGLIVAATAGYAVQALAPPGSVVDDVVLAVEVGIAAVAVAGVMALAVRWRRGSYVQRQQLKWLLLAVAVLLVHYAVADVLPDPVTTVTAVAVPLLLPAAVAVAVLHHGLYDIDVLVSRALVSSTLTAGVLVVYVGSVAAFGRASGLQLGPALVATTVVAVAFDPVRRRVQTAVNRLIYGRRDEPIVVLSRLGQRLEETVSAEVLLPVVALEIAGALRLRHVAIDVRLGDDLHRAAQHGAPTGEDVALPLVHQGVDVGVLTIAPRGRGDHLTVPDFRLLTDIGRQVAASAHAVRLAESLRRSHERLATVRTEERRRLRADLHDGLGPLLAGIELGIGGARRMVKGQEAAAVTLDKLSQRVGAAKSEVRRLLEGLRPGAVEQVGLIEALHEEAALIGHIDGAPQVVVDAEGLWAVVLPPGVQDAAYRIATEALTNVLRHARATRCTVHLAAEDGGSHLRLEVADDGRGLGDAPPGTGRSSMVQRAERLGGRVEVRTGTGGGATVVARLPLVEATEAPTSRPQGRPGGPRPQRSAQALAQ